MKTKKINAIVSKFMLLVLSLVLAFSLFACDVETLPAPEVKKVTLDVESGYVLGEIGATHTLSYSATEGSDVEVSLKKGTEAATSADCTYTASSKTIVFSQVGEYTVTVKATMNGVSDEESVTVTAVAPAPVLTDVSVQAKSGEIYGRTGQEHVVGYTVSAGSNVSVSVKKDNADAQTEDYSYQPATKIITFNNEGEYEIVVTATKNSQQAQKIVPVSVYDLEAPTFTQAASLAAKEGETAGRIESVHVLSYTVESETVSVSVKKNGEPAVSGTDYTYDDSTQEIVFLKAGAYEVIVSATTAGKTSKSIAAIEIASVAAPVVSGLLLAPSQYGYLRGQELGLSYQVDVPNDAYPVSDCQVSVSVQKGTLDGEEYTYTEMTAGNGYTYDSENQKLTFSTMGNYKVVVSASAHGATGSSSVTVNVRDFARPVFTFGFAEEKVEEGGTVAYTLSDVTYDAGDSAAPGGEQIQYSVRYKVRANAEWEASSEDDGKWTMSETAFTANKTGYYEVTASVTSAQGTIGQQVAVLYSAPKEIKLTSSENYTGEWMRVAKDTLVTLDYTVSDPALVDSYDLTEVADEGFTVNGTSVTAQFSELGTYTASITYTHKEDSEYKKTIEYKLSVVDDVDNAPKFVGDPFGGMYDTLIPSVGLALYYGATDKDGNAIEDYAGVAYEISSTPTSGTASIGEDNVKYPYVIVKNPTVGTASGTVTVKMTVTVDGYSAVSYKTFQITSLSSSLTMTDYMKAATGCGDNDLYQQLENNNKGSNTNSGVTHRNNSLVTKTGIVFNRANSSSIADGDMMNVFVNETSTHRVDFTLEFDFTPLARTSNNCSLAVFLVPAAGWDGDGKVALYTEDGAGKDGNLHCWNWGESWGNRNGGTDVPDALGKTVRIQIIYTVAGGTASVKVSWKLPTDSSYTTWFTMSASTSKSSGGGSPINRVQFTHEKGCYAIENLSYTEN